MSSPSIIPNDRLDRDFYIVLEDFSSGDAFRETDEGIDHQTLMQSSPVSMAEYSASSPSVRTKADLETPQKTSPASSSVASAGREASEGLQDFIEGQLGRKIRVQLPLPLLV